MRFILATFLVSRIARSGEERPDYFQVASFLTNSRKFLYINPIYASFNGTIKSPRHHLCRSRHHSNTTTGLLPVHEALRVSSGERAPLLERGVRTDVRKAWVSRFYYVHPYATGPTSAFRPPSPICRRRCRRTERSHVHHLFRFHKRLSNPEYPAVTVPRITVDDRAQ